MSVDRITLPLTAPHCCRMRTVFFGDPLSGPLGFRPTDTRAICRHNVTRYVPLYVVTGCEAADKTQGYTLLHPLPEQPMSRTRPYPVRRPSVASLFRKEV